MKPNLRHSDSSCEIQKIVIGIVEIALARAGNQFELIGVNANDNAPSRVGTVVHLDSGKDHIER